MELNNCRYPTLLRQGNVMVLDAHHVRDLHLTQYVRFLFNPHGAALIRWLATQVDTICTLNEVFGPNQFVLVAPQGNPLSPEWTTLVVPQTLHSCLLLTYIMVWCKPGWSKKLLNITF